MNNIVIAGRLTKDVELKYIPSTGKAVANFSVAVNRRFKKDTADFFNIVVWEKQAENCANYLAKGSEVVIAGEMQQRSFDGKEGQKVYVWELIAQEVQFVGGKKIETPSNFSSQLGEAETPFIPKGLDEAYKEIDEESVPF